MNHIARLFEMIKDREAEYSIVNDELDIIVGNMEFQANIYNEHQINDVIDAIIKHG